MCFDLSPAQAEKGANKPNRRISMERPTRGHSGESLGSRPSEQIQKQRFCLIVPMVSDRCDRNPFVRCDLGDCIVPKKSRCLLYGFFAVVRHEERVEAADVQGYVALLAPRSNERFITIGCIASEPVIEMDGGYAVAQAEQDIRKHDRIDTTAQSDQNMILLREQPVVLDKIAYRINGSVSGHALRTHLSSWK